MSKMKFTMREKIIRIINKFPKPIVVMVGLGIMFSANNIGDYLWKNQEVPKYMSVLTSLLIYGMGLIICFSPKDYQLLKTREEEINEKDERNRFIANNARAKSINILQWIFAAFFLICSSSEELRGYCLLWGGLIFIQIISEMYYKKKLEGEY